MSVEGYDEVHPYCNKHGMVLEPPNYSDFLTMVVGGIALKLMSSQYQKIKQKSMKHQKCTKKIFTRRLPFDRHYICTRWWEHSEKQNIHIPTVRELTAQLQKQKLTKIIITNKYLFINSNYAKFCLLSLYPSPQVVNIIRNFQNSD